MNLQELRENINELEQHIDHAQLRPTIKRQIHNLEKHMSKHDKMPVHQEKNALNCILGALTDNDDNKVVANTLHWYRDLLLTNQGKARYLQFNLNKASREFGLNGQRPNMINLARNVLIHRFGVGVHDKILSVNSKIDVLNNRPIINVIIKYI